MSSARVSPYPPDGWNLLLILIGMPLIAAAVAWLVTLREPPGIARQPLE